MSTPAGSNDSGDGENTYILVEMTPKGAKIPGKQGASNIIAEEDSMHPVNSRGRHEVHIIPGRVVKVGQTPRIREMIGLGIIREVFDRPETQQIDLLEVLDAPPQTANNARHVPSRGGERVPPAGASSNGDADSSGGGSGGQTSQGGSGGASAKQPKQ